MMPLMAIPNSFDILQAVIDATPDAIFVKDLEGRYVLVNAAFIRFIGKLHEDIVGKNDYELYPEADARAFVEADRTVLATGRPQVFEGVATGQDGQPQTYLGSASRTTSPSCARRTRTWSAPGRRCSALRRWKPSAS